MYNLVRLVTIIPNVIMVFVWHANINTPIIFSSILWHEVISEFFEHLVASCVTSVVLIDIHVFPSTLHQNIFLASSNMFSFQMFSKFDVPPPSASCILQRLQVFLLSCCLVKYVQTGLVLLLLIVKTKTTT